MRASTWGPVAIRVGAVVLALLVLGWIGRTAAAGPTSATSVVPSGDDAGASMTGAPASALLEAGPASTPPASTSTAAVQAAPNASRGRASTADPVYLNHASVDELRRLPGVGAKRAEAILVLRQRVGKFQRVEELLRVKGVGRGAVKKWRPLVRLDSPPAADAGSP